MDHQLAWEGFMEAARNARRPVPPAPGSDPICGDRLRHVGIPREVSRAGSHCPLCHPRRGWSAELAITGRLIDDASGATLRVARAAHN